MTGKRNRGVYLDPGKVQHYAGKLGIYSPHRLEIEYLRYHRVPETRTDLTPRKAWTGKKKIEKSKAGMLASVLGLDSYHPLLKTESRPSPWSQLIHREECQSRFMRFVNHLEQAQRLVDFGEQCNDTERPAIPIDARWHLEFSGRSGQMLFILLQSQDRSFVLAPIEGDDYRNIFTDDCLRYPQHGTLRFSAADGLGPRTLIAIRAPDIPMTARNPDTGFDCTAEELNQLARRMQNIPTADLAVDRYAFRLVE